MTLNVFLLKMVTWFVTWVLMFLLLWLHATMKILLIILTSELITQDQTEHLWVQNLSRQCPAPCQAPPILHTQGVGIYSENPWRLTFKLFYSENQTHQFKTGFCIFTVLTYVLILVLCFSQMEPTHSMLMVRTCQLLTWWHAQLHWEDLHI